MIVGSVTLQDTATSPEPRVQNTRRVVDHDVPARSLFAQVHDADGAAPRPAVQGTGHFDVSLEACEQELRAEGELSSLSVPAPESPVEIVTMPHPEDLTGVSLWGWAAPLTSVAPGRLSRWRCRTPHLTRGGQGEPMDPAC
jgi:hypothetical protein